MSYNPFDELVQRLERIESQNALLLNQLSAILPSKQEAEFLTREEAAGILQISVKTLGQWTKDGTVTGYRIGSRVRIKKHEVEASLNQIKTKSIA